MARAQGHRRRLVTPAPAQRRGRRGNIRANTRLWAIGVILCARLGHETTTANIHRTLTTAISRELQWDLGVLRKPTTRKSTKERTYDPEMPRLVSNGKLSKEVFIHPTDERLSYEKIGYDDISNAVSAILKRLNYGAITAKNLDEQERLDRRDLCEGAVDRLISVTVIDRTNSTVAIDGTGIWAWAIGAARGRTAAQKTLDAGQNKHASEDGYEDGGPQVLEVAAIETDDNGLTAPSEHPGAAPPDAEHRTDDANWGYKTSKGGGSEVGFGFHQHTIVRIPDSGDNKGSEPLLIEGMVLVPANEDVVAPSLRLIDRAARRSPIKRVIGDLLCTNLRADRWAVPLAQRGIEQVLAMRADAGGVVDFHGAKLHLGWLRCASAPMDQRPLPTDFAKDDTEEHYDAVDEFRQNWAFHRKEAGLGANGSSKWICPAMTGKVGCFARGEDSVAVAKELGLPIVVPPKGWENFKSCTNKSLDFTPDATNAHHQRKLMQRLYYGCRQWRREFNLRYYIEGTFGILKNPSRLRIRRGHNRIPGLAMANNVNGLKVALFNEQQLRTWYQDQLNAGNADAVAHLVDHPLLQPDPYDWGFTDNTKESAAQIDRAYLLDVGDSARTVKNSSPGQASAIDDAA